MITGRDSTNFVQFNDFLVKIHRISKFTLAEWKFLLPMKFIHFFDCYKQINR